MAVKLTEHQMMITKGMVEFAEASANQIYHIMVNHGLDKIEGCQLRITVDPQFDFVTMSVELGARGKSDFGHIELTKGKKANDKYAPLGKNSEEYEWLFADETLRKRMAERNGSEKPLPPDGLWIGDPRNDCPVDSWREWDVNDSLS